MRKGVLEEPSQEFLGESSRVHTSFLLTELVNKENVEAALEISVEKLGHGVLKLPPPIDNDITVAVLLVVILSHHLSEDQETGINGQ
jgi:hypothetical protein